MGGFMNWKKIVISFIVVFVVLEVLNFVIHSLILGATYESMSELWRPEIKMWIMWIADLIFSFFFVFIFVKGYEGRGIMEGIRFGLVIGCFYVIPGIYSQYAVYNLPYSIILQWLISGFITMVIIGIVAALLYKPEAEAKS
jgi:hypothetical protein